MEQTGDTYGTTRLRLRNRGGQNGALFENAGVDLVDFIFKTSAGAQGNLRFEHRAGVYYSALNEADSQGEFQFATSGSGTVGLAVGRKEAIFMVPTTVAIQNATDEGITVRGAVSQSGNLQAWKNNAGTVVTRVESDATMSSPGTGTDSQHFGHASSASGNDSTAFGHFARAAGNQSTALGSVSLAANTYAVAVGQSASATGSGAFALGSSASASGTNCVSLGVLANVTGNEALALGTLAVVTANSGTAIGHSSMVNHVGSIALGHFATTTKANQLVIGSPTTPIGEVLFKSTNPVFQLEAATNTFIVRAASAPSANMQEWQDVTGSTGTVVTSDRAIVPFQKTKSQLIAFAPAAAGEMFYCSDCTTDAVVVSTGTGTGAFARISARATGIQ